MTPDQPDELHLSEDDCLGLLSNSLSPHEGGRLLQHLRICAACEALLCERDAEWARFLIASAPALRRLDQGEPRGRWLSKWTARVARGLAPPRARLGWVMAVGLILVVAAGLVVRVQEERRRAFLSELAWLPPLPAGAILRSGESTGTLETLRGGLEAYARRDLPAAITLFSSVKVRSESEPLRQAYLGSALARAGRYSEAVTHLRHLDPTLIPEPWSTEVRWTLMIALEESGQRSRADSLLRALAEEPGQSGQRAKALLTHTR